jgi:hypothetical protein
MYLFDALKRFDKMTPDEIQQLCTYWYIEAIPELLELATEFQRTSIQGGRQ